METLAQYFDRTKGSKQRSLQRLGHPGRFITMIRSYSGTSPLVDRIRAYTH